MVAIMPGDIEPCPNRKPHGRHLWFAPGAIPDPAYTNECPGIPLTCPNGHPLHVFNNEFIECSMYEHSTRPDESGPRVPVCDFPQIPILDLVGLRFRVIALAKEFEGDGMYPAVRPMFARHLRELLNPPKDDS